MLKRSGDLVQKMGLRNAYSVVRTADRARIDLRAIHDHVTHGVSRRAISTFHMLFSASDMTTGSGLKALTVANHTA